MARAAFSLARSALLLVGAAVASATAASAQAPAAPTSGKFETLAGFLARTRSATLDSFRGRASVRDPAAFEEMKAHVLSLYRGVTASHSFFEDGHYVDCIPRERQPSLQSPAARREKADRAAKAVVPPQVERPDPPPGATQGLDLTLKRGQKDAFGRAMYCPSGTIPMRRLTLEEMVRFPTLREFLRAGKRDDGSLDGKREDRPEDASTHYYARGAQYVDNYGGDSWLNVWNPTVASHRMSLSQIWVVGGDGSSKQTVEAGWQVYPDKWGSTNAALFIFYTTKGYDDGCYNVTCTGFVQIANNVYLGRGFTNYSSDGGTQWGFNLQWKRHTDGNWWLFYKGPGSYIAVGYYPKSLFGTGTLATKATKIAFGGEDTGKLSAKQMGSGKKAADGWQHAAFQNRAFYIDTRATSVWADLTKYEPDPTCYTANIHNIYGSWGTYLYFGGPSCN
jgi:hypothetical protein